jgi:hypothetical protein
MTTTPLKSLAHPEWPYAGTVHEWRGFVRTYDPAFVAELLEAAESPPEATFKNAEDALNWLNDVTYQKQNFGPKLD